MIIAEHGRGSVSEGLLANFKFHWCQDCRHVFVAGLVRLSQNLVSTVEHDAIKAAGSANMVKV